jgi:hypothetical protein
VDWRVRVSCASERRLPEARLVDASRDGVLMVLDEPTGFAVGQPIVLSIEPADDTFVVVADVVRVERGSDFRTYVAVALRVDDVDDLDRWEARLAEPSADEPPGPPLTLVSPDDLAGGGAALTLAPEPPPGATTVSAGMPAPDFIATSGMAS